MVLILSPDTLQTSQTVCKLKAQTPLSKNSHSYISYISNSYIHNCAFIPLTKSERKKNIDYKG